MLQQLKIRHRLFLIIAMSLVGFLVLVGESLYTQKQSAFAAQEARIINLSEVVVGVLEYYNSLEKEGRVSKEEAQNSARMAVSQLRYSKTEGFYIFNSQGLGIAHATNPKFVGVDTCTSNEPVFKAVCASIRRTVEGRDPSANKPYVISSMLPDSSELVDKIAFSRYFGPWGWVVGTSSVISDVNKAFREQVITLAVFAIALLLLVAVLSLFVATSITRQLGGEPDEAVELMRRAAQGDFTIGNDIRSGSDRTLLGALASMLQSLRDMLGEVVRNAERVSVEASLIAEATNQVTAAAVQQSEATSAMASAMQEMSANISHISDNACDTETNSSGAATLAEEGTRAASSAVAEINQIVSTVSNASGKIAELVRSAEEIGTIANVIKEIAGQTNLLALNAAIEAARAGDQGRGFAVVADEVRKLAERTSSATLRIEQMIGGIQSETVSSVEAMQEAGPRVQKGVAMVGRVEEVLSQIHESATETLGRIRDVAHAAHEQSLASDAIAAKVEQIAQMVERTTESTVKTSNAVKKLESLASSLHTNVGCFRF